MRLTPHNRITLKTKEKMKTYISLPIKGKDLGEVRAYAESVEKMLTSYGIDAVNPLKNGLPADSPDCDHMRRDYRNLTDCQAILMCDGWEYSHGCMNEMQVAADMRLKIVYDHQPWDEIIQTLTEEL